MSYEVCSPACYSPVMGELLNIQNHGQEFCLVHERDVFRSGKDIDLVIKDPVRFTDTIRELGYYPLTGHHWIKYIAAGKVWMVIDLSDKYSFFSHHMKAADYAAIIDSSIPTCADPRIKKLSDLDLAVYTLFKGALVRGYYPAKYVRIIDTITQEQLHEFGSERYRFLPKPLSDYCDDFASAKNNDGALENFIAQTQRELNKSPHRRSWCSRFVLRARRLFFRNRAIAVVGPDGSGKTSIVQELSKLPLVHVKYMGPGQGDSEILPLFRAVRDRFDRLRHRWRKGTIRGNAVRLAYLLVVHCDLLFRFYSQKWKWDGGDIVVFDRFAFDVYIRNPDIIRKVLFVHLFPMPRVVVLLEGDPEKIHQRKPELSIDEITDTYRRYTEIMNLKRTQCLTIQTTDHTTAQSVMAIVEGLFRRNIIPIVRA